MQSEVAFALRNRASAGRLHGMTPLRVDRGPQTREFGAAVSDAPVRPTFFVDRPRDRFPLPQSVPR